MRDVYGREIEPGAQVAYNLSGEVRIGVVDEVKTALRYGRLADLIIVRGDNEKKSKVTNRRNLVVITRVHPVYGERV